MKTKNLLIIIVILAIIVVAGFILFNKSSDKVQNENIVLSGETKEFEINVKN